MPQKLADPRFPGTHTSCNPTVVLVILMLVGTARADDSAQPWQVHGKVIDEQGAPVEDFEAATFWLSNHTFWDDNGELLMEAKEGKLWTNEGELAASPRLAPERLPGGRFSLTVEGRPRTPIFAVDKRHERGGIVVVDGSSADKPITITLAPLVRVTAEVYCSEAGRTPEWSGAVVFTPDGLRFMQCGSFRGKVSFLLPPGTYELFVYSKSPSGLLRPQKQPNGKAADQGLVEGAMPIEVSENQAKLDLGRLDVMLPRDKDGVPRDLTQYYGKAPPELAITDARGVPRNVKLVDFRGKWVVLDFWALWCGPCTHLSMPELIEFYEEHAADRDRFEILAICNTEEEKVQTIEAYDALAAPLVKEAWSGTQLPFPVLLDGEGKTYGIYGIETWPTMLLIDPDGHLVKGGDLKMLSEKLKQKKPSQSVQTQP